MWNVDRIDAPQAWKTTTGSKAVTVGVADTGLDYTNSELATQVAGVVDFTGLEGSPTICEQVYGTGYTDAGWAATYGGPANTDWNGHGTWIGGNIAAALDGVGINGIAPNVKLVALKISQWCGYAYDSEILAAFTYAANHGIDVVSISFGGYLDLTDPGPGPDLPGVRQDRAVRAAQGHAHRRRGRQRARANRRRGPRAEPRQPRPFRATPSTDLYGLYETPGGIPGVVDVSATNNVVAAPSAHCPPGTTGDTPDAYAQPGSDLPVKDNLHQPTGVGRQNQLAYYSNYGPRIDVAAPGGAREFNIPRLGRRRHARIPLYHGRRRGLRGLQHHLRLGA